MRHLLSIKFALCKGPKIWDNIYMKIVKALILLMFLSCSGKDQSQQAKEKFYREHKEMLKDNKTRSELILKESFSYRGLEFIYVDFGKIYYSFWGHALIRFVGSGKTPLDDLTLSFIADFNDYNLDNWKAYFGGYEVLPELKPLRDYMDEYIKGESREMHRYIFQTTQDQRDDFLKLIRSWVKDNKKPGPYTFRKNNCSGLIMKALYEAKISPIKDIETYPFDMPIQFHQAKLIKLPKIDLTFGPQVTLPQSLYEKCEKRDCSLYYKNADKFFPNQKLKEKKELRPYIFRLFWWAKKLITLLLS
jgi:hypothetical protein